MNERIKELARESGLLVHNPEGVPTKLEKFAELIVKECISIVNEQKECLHEEQQYWHDRDYGYALAVDDASKGIKQFFGVQE
jgi:hypothetical protein